MKKKISKKKQPQKKNKSKVLKNKTKKKSIFKKNIKNIKKKKLIKKKSVNTNFQDIQIINIKTSIDGEVLNNSVLRIFGNIKGKIIGKKIIIEKNAIINAIIECNDIVVFGRCYADIYVKDSCNLMSGSQINGDIYYDNLISVQTGSKIFGQLIPKNKPLALPYYGNNNKLEISDTTNISGSNKHSEKTQVQNQVNLKSRRSNTLDKIIEKIFK